MEDLDAAGLASRAATGPNIQGVLEASLAGLDCMFEGLKGRGGMFCMWPKQEPAAPICNPQATWACLSSGNPVLVLDSKGTLQQKSPM